MNGRIQRKGAKIMSEITYRQDGDYLVPDITITEQERPIGRYGRMRRQYLKEHRPGFYHSLCLSETLHPHLLEIEDTANRRLSQMTQEMAQAEGITEELKAKDQMAWVGGMNSIRARAEEIILQELIYS
jgi:hypothetical protein